MTNFNSPVPNPNQIDTTVLPTNAPNAPCGLTNEQLEKQNLHGYAVFKSLCEIIERYNKMCWELTDTLEDTAITDPNVDNRRAFQKFLNKNSKLQIDLVAMTTKYEEVSATIDIF